MRILAIETASPPGSVALLDGEQVVCASAVESPRKTTQQFASLMRKLLDEASWSPQEIQFVAATTGPGSFTGLRIGVTAAKVFAYAVGGTTIGINTLEVIAAQCPPTDHPIEVVIDAQRKQLFAARFQWIENRLRWLEPTRILDAEKWLAQRASDAMLIGTGLKKYKASLPPGIVMDERHWTPRAETLGRLAHAAAHRGDTTAPMQLAPNYFRQSAAEEKLLRGR